MMFSEPRAAMASGMVWPVIIFEKASKMGKQGGRARTRYGCLVPSETR